MPLFSKEKLTKEQKEEQRAARKAVYHKDYVPINIREKPPERETVDEPGFVARDATVTAEVKHVYRMGGKNKVVIAEVTCGTLNVGDTVFVSSDSDVTDKSKVLSIAQFGKEFGAAAEGARVQITLEAPNVNVRKHDILFIKEDV